MTNKERNEKELTKAVLAFQEAISAFKKAQRVTTLKGHLQKVEQPLKRLADRLGVHKPKFKATNDGSAKFENPVKAPELPEPEDDKVVLADNAETEEAKTEQAKKRKRGRPKKKKSE
jgi:hypothetical protein